MKIPGTITLYNEKGIQIASRKYGSIIQLRRTIGYWQKLYYENFIKYYYQMAPGIEDEEEIETLKTA